MLSQFSLGLYDWISNVFAPVVVGTGATAALVLRVLLQKRRVGQPGIWRRNCKMVIQLVSVSTIYIIVWIPIVVCFVVPLIVPSPFTLELVLAVLNYLQYIPCLLCPFMCLVGLPEIRDSFKQMLTRMNTVQPLSQNRTTFTTRLPQHQPDQNRGISSF